MYSKNITQGQLSKKEGPTRKTLKRILSVVDAVFVVVGRIERAVTIRALMSLGWIPSFGG